MYIIALQAPATRWPRERGRKEGAAVEVWANIRLLQFRFCLPRANIAGLHRVNLRKHAPSSPMTFDSSFAILHIAFYFLASSRVVKCSSSTRPSFLPCLLFRASLKKFFSSFRTAVRCVAFRPFRATASLPASQPSQPLQGHSSLPSLATHFSPVGPMQ